MTDKKGFDWYWIGLMLAFLAIGWYYTNVNARVGGVYGFLLAFFTIFKLADSVGGTTKYMNSIPLINKKTLWKDLALAAVIGLAFSFIITSAGSIFYVPPLSIDKYAESFFVVVFMAAFVEESVFRGLVQPTLKMYMKKAAFLAIIITALLFALYHWGAYGANAQNTMPLFTAGFIGLMLGLLGANLFKSLLPLMVIHGIINASVLIHVIHSAGA